MGGKATERRQKQEPLCAQNEEEAQLTLGRTVNYMHARPPAAAQNVIEDATNVSDVTRLFHAHYSF